MSFHNSLTGADVHETKLTILDDSPVTLNTVASAAGILVVDNLNQLWKANSTTPGDWTQAGSLTSIQDGGTIGGTYYGSLLLKGSATLTDNLVVNGSVYCVGDITNSGGYSIEVMGDLLVGGSCNFTPSDPGFSQGNVIVHGDFHFGYFEMSVNAGQAPYVSVLGDLVNTDNDDFRGHGQDGADGLQVDVGGDAIIDYMNLGGGNSTPSGRAGNSGSLYVRGDCITYDGIDIYGGDSYNDGQPAGNGGSINTEGDFVGYIYAVGGFGGANCSAGSGGSVNCVGTYTNFWSLFAGGDCNSSNSGDYAGSGGSVETAQLLGDSYMNLDGGNRGGTLGETDNTTGAPSAGNVTCYGNMFVSHLELIGGTNITVNSDGGQGGSIDCKGDIIAWHVNASGGGSAGRNGGNGGQITTKGRLNLEYVVYADGGTGAVEFTNGSAGLLTAKAGLLTDNVYLRESGEGSTSTNTCGILTSGNCHINYLEQVDRANSLIKNWYPGKILFSASTMVTKKTLNNTDNSATSDISADLATSIFSFDPNSNPSWVKIAGTSI